VVMIYLKVVKLLQTFYFIISLKVISFTVESFTKIGWLGVLKLSLRIFFLPDLDKFEAFDLNEDYREESRKTSSWFSFCWSTGPHFQ